MDEVHTIARRGYSRGTDAYVRGRPGFPAAALSWLRDDLGLRPNTVAVDLGAGTGKFTRLLVETGAAVTAVEPVAEMRERLTHDLPTVTALAGEAQSSVPKPFTGSPRPNRSPKSAGC